MDLSRGGSSGRGGSLGRGGFPGWGGSPSPGPGRGSSASLRNSLKRSISICVEE